MTENFLSRASVGERLRLERERLGLSQVELGGVGGVSRRTQMAYEAGEQSPNVDYLTAIRQAGADVGFVLIGEKLLTGLELDERERGLIRAFRSMKVALQDSILLVVDAVGRGATAPIDA